ncbi:unnamed protein product, partial [Nesidiocoris tenuis]
MVGDLCVDLKFCQSVRPSSNRVRLSPSRRGLTSVRVKRLSKTLRRQASLGANAARRSRHTWPLLTDLRCIDLSAICRLPDRTNILQSTNNNTKRSALVPICFALRRTTSSNCAAFLMELDFTTFSIQGGVSFRRRAQRHKTCSQRPARITFERSLGLFHLFSPSRIFKHDR